MFQITRKTLPALALATTIAGFSGAGWAADPWVVEAGDSEIEFTGTQLGAAFEGEFKSFTAEIVFSPDERSVHIRARLKSTSFSSALAVWWERR